MVFRSASPFLLIRLVGMMFPGKFAFESGSLTAISAPPGFSDWEKSPALSRAVGRVWTAGVDPADLLAAGRPAVTLEGHYFDPQRGVLSFTGDTAEAVLLELEAPDDKLGQGVAWLREQGIKVDPIEGDMVLP